MGCAVGSGKWTIVVCPGNCSKFNDANILDLFGEDVHSTLQSFSIPCLSALGITNCVRGYEDGAEILATLCRVNILLHISLVSASVHSQVRLGEIMQSEFNQAGLGELQC